MVLLLTHQHGRCSFVSVHFAQRGSNHSGHMVRGTAQEAMSLTKRMVRALAFGAETMGEFGMICIRGGYTSNNTSGR